METLGPIEKIVNLFVRESDYRVLAATGIMLGLTLSFLNIFLSVWIVIFLFKAVGIFWAAVIYFIGSILVRQLAADFKKFLFRPRGKRNG